MRVVGTPTSGSLVDLVFDEEIDHRDDRGKESKVSCERLVANLWSSRQTL